MNFASKRLIGCALVALVLAIGNGPNRAICEDAKTPVAAPAAGNTTPERLSVAQARERAKLMHTVYTATLDVIHHHYFRPERAVLPARAMEDVFDTVAKETDAKASWIAVNTKAMSVHHEPKTDFEKKAAEEIGNGKADYERIEAGTYYRATAIPFADSCISCHTGFFSKTPKSQRYAGLIISMPVRENAADK